MPSSTYYTVLLALVLGMGCEKKSPTVKIADSNVEEAIRESLIKPVGELTKADLEEVRQLDLSANQLTEIQEGLEKLAKLGVLFLGDNKLTNVKGLKELTKLTTLWLNDNQLTDVRSLNI